MIGSDIHESLCFEVLKVFRLSSHVVGEAMGRCLPQLQAVNWMNIGSDQWELNEHIHSCNENQASRRAQIASVEGPA